MKTPYIFRQLHKRVRTTYVCPSVRPHASPRLPRRKQNEDHYSGVNRPLRGDITLAGGLSGIRTQIGHIQNYNSGWNLAPFPGKNRDRAPSLRVIPWHSNVKKHGGPSFRVVEKSQLGTIQHIEMANFWHIATTSLSTPVPLGTP